MALWLQILVGIVLVAVGACLVPLLLQARRTAASVQRLAESAREDLHQIAADVHHLRSRADALADLALTSLEFPLGLSRIVAGTAQALELFMEKAGLPWMGALLTGIKYALTFFRRPKKGDRTKEDDHE